ncbi:MAG: flagellar hook capping FlgD N-terminal domain-containing protein [Bryobacteraceae bacterium]
MASNSANTSGTNSMSNTSAFLQLLVAQLKNQDPTQPMDPTTFVTQLAEFNDVQQNLGTRQDMDAMSEKYLGLTTPPSANSSTADGTAAADGSGSNSNQTSGTSGTGSSGNG